MKPAVRSGVLVGSEVVPIPPAFWDEVFDEDIDWKNSSLNRRACRRLWRMLGRTDQCPKVLKVVVNKEELLRAFPQPH